MKETIKKIITVVLTITVLVGSLAGFSVLVTPLYPSGLRSVHSDMWKDFYSAEENSVDVFFVGSSTVYNAILPSDLYKDYGFTSYDLASPHQTTIFSELYIREGLRYQHPSVIVLDQSLFMEPDLDGDEAHFRITMDNLKLSWDKVKMAWYIANHSENQSFLSFIFPGLRYHTLWTQLVRDGIDTHLKERSEDIRYQNKGADSLPLINIQRNSPMFETDTGDIAEGFDEDSLKAFERIVSLCKEQNITLVVIKLPIMNKNITYEQSRAVAQLCDSMGVTYINYNEADVWETLGLDPEKSFQNLNHLNLLSAEKMTAYIGKYLSEEYELPDHRGDPDYEEWNQTAKDTRTQQMDKLSEYSGTKKTECMLRATRVSNKDIEVCWPVMSYVEGIKLYRQEPDKEKVLLTEELTGYYLDVGVSAKSEYTIEYAVEGFEEPYVITFTAYNPFKATRSDDDIKITVTQFPGDTNYELYKRQDDGSWQAVDSARKALNNGKAFTDKKVGSGEVQYQVRYTDQTGEARTFKIVVKAVEE